DGIIEDEAKKSEYLATITSKATKMNELIDRLFEYVKLESAENLLHKEKCDVAEILRNCLAEVYADYEEQKIQLEIEIPETAVTKNADKVELSRVYTNLLNNVLKHNPSGIRVLVKMDAEGRVVIADSGEKIPAEVKDSLFMPFVSGDKSRSSKNGSGLGLSLAYKIMKKHDGSLRLEENVPGYTKGFVAEF
ncbi:MAG: HAMP domain-containing histidine kinase, partial [Treponema sp.]|nr:HAMP domain-containing histidine kinase [Treponema sp.]